MASVIEKSKEIELKYKPLSIVTNIQGVHAYIDELTEPFMGEVDVSTKELEGQARKAIAGLNSCIKKIDKQRIKEIKELRKPIDELDKELKDLVKKGNDAYRNVKDKIDEKVESQRAAKEAELKEYYRGLVDDELASLIPYEKISDDGWKTTSCRNAEDLLKDKAQEILGDIQEISRLELNYPAKALTHYYETLSVTHVMKNDRELKEKEEAEKAHEKAVKAAMGIEPVQEEIFAPVIKSKPAKKGVGIETATYALIMEDVTQFDAVEIAKTAERFLGKKPRLVKNPGKDLQ